MLIISLLIIALNPAYAEQLTSGVSFAQISFTGSNPAEKYSHYGQVSVDFTMLYGEGYINVERYEHGQAAGWMVKNLPVVSGSVLPGYSTMLDLGHAGYQSSLNAYVDFSSAPLADDSSLRNQQAATYHLAEADYPFADPSPAGNDNDLYWTAEKETCKGTIQIFEFPFKDWYPLTDGKASVCFQNLTGKPIVFADFTWVLGGDQRKWTGATCDKAPFWGNCYANKAYGDWLLSRTGTVNFTKTPPDGEKAAPGIANKQVFRFNVQNFGGVKKFFLEFYDKAPK